jgi:hypothetical protein
VIGPRWTAARDKHGRCRLEDPHDFVRLEIETALARKVPIIPVLVAAAEMPDPEDLPESLAPLTRRQALEVSETRFDYDVGQLIDVLRTMLGGTSKTPAEPAGQGETQSTEKTPPPAGPTDAGAGRKPGKLAGELEAVVLPPSVRDKLAGHSRQLQLRFLDVYARQRRKLPIAYLLLILPYPLFGLHNSYLHLKRRQVVFWLVCLGAAVLGVATAVAFHAEALLLLYGMSYIWPAIDLFLLPGMVRQCNADIALKLVFDDGEREPA